MNYRGKAASLLMAMAMIIPSSPLSTALVARNEPRKVGLDDGDRERLAAAEDKRQRKREKRARGK